MASHALLFAAGIVVLGLTANAASAAVINVPADHATIQAAIDAAVDGDTVLVGPGTYAEHLAILGKGITLTSTAPDDPSVVAATVIEPGTAGAVIYLPGGAGGPTIIRGFTISPVPGDDWGNIGVLCSDTAVVVENNVFSVGARALRARGSSVEFAQNHVSGQTRGGLNIGACSVTIVGNTFTGNSGEMIGLYVDCSGTVANNEISWNVGSYAAINVVACTDVELTENNVHDTTGHGIAVSAGSTDVLIENNVIERNVLHRDGSGAGVHVGGTNARIQIVGNTIRDNVAGTTTGAGGGIGAWGCEDMLIHGNIVTGNRAVWSAGISSNGSGTITDNLIANNTAEGHELSAFGGLAVGPWSGTIRGNTISGNTAVLGGGVGIGGGTSDLVFEGNTITGNSAPGAPGYPGSALFAFEGSFPLIEDNVIADNECGAIWVGSGHPVHPDDYMASAPVIRQNTIHGNAGDGVVVGQTSRATVLSNSIAGNAGLGIDLGDDGPTANDPGDGDTGPSCLQNFPRLVSAISDGGSTTVAGTLNSTANTTFTVEFFANDASDPSGYGEGKTYLGSAEVTTDGSGDATFEVILAASVDYPEFITSTATDPEGNTSEFSLNVNDAPVVVSVSGPTDPVSTGTTVYLDAEFTDADVDDAHVAVWNWGDGREETVTDAESPLSASQSYGEPGVYPVSLTVTDIDGAEGQSVFGYVVVYDSSAGFVTGGGWIDSPSGAYVPESTVAGKATFGFVSRYKKGANVPEGKTVFRFHAGDLGFDSTEYQWLVIAGPHAKFKGRGTINGEGDYGFMVTATDGAVDGGGGVDTFRIKITGSGGLVYDNKMGEPDDSNAGTEIGGGNIVVHKEK